MERRIIGRRVLLGLLGIKRQVKGLFFEVFGGGSTISI